MAKSTLKYDPEFIEALKPLLATPPPQAQNALELRESANQFMSMGTMGLPPTPGVTETLFEVTSQDGTSIPVFRYSPDEALKDGSAARPAIVYVHGGGMVAGNVDPIFKPVIAQLAAGTGFHVFGVEYRLAPEHPFPAPIDDTYAALKWVSADAAKLGVDPARIVVYGVSAGGGLAAGVALKARDEGLSPPIAKQILHYPMLDDRTNVGDDQALGKLVLGWTQTSNTIGWAAYLKDSDMNNVSPYAVPARATDLRGLPRTYIDTGNLDLFRDEVMAYATRLMAADIDVEVHIYPGVTHGFEFMAPKIGVTQRANENRIRAIMDV